MRKKLIRISTVPESLSILLNGQLKYLSAHYELTVVSGGGKELEEVRRREGVHTEAIAMVRKISPVKDLISLWNLYCYFRNEKPDIIHSITPKAGLLSMMAGWLAHVPVRIHTFTGLIFPSRSGLMYHLLKNTDRMTCAFATKIIPEGEGVKRDLMEHRVTHKPLKVIGNGNVNGIDTAYFSPEAVDSVQREEIRQKYGVVSGDFVFVYVGRLVKDKGINELIAAFVDIHMQNPHTKLILVGYYEQEHDPLLPKTHRLIETHPGIFHTGYQPDVRPFLAVAHALVFPSYREGFPNVPMQAGAMGLPSLVTDINGCNEIILHEFNGLIVPPKEKAALKNAMLRLLEDKELTRKLASNARESIISRFEQIPLWELIKEEYSKCLQEKGIVHPWVVCQPGAEKA